MWTVNDTKKAYRDLLDQLNKAVDMKYFDRFKGDFQPTANQLGFVAQDAKHIRTRILDPINRNGLTQETTKQIGKVFQQYDLVNNPENFDFNELIGKIEKLALTVQIYKSIYGIWQNATNSNKYGPADKTPAVRKMEDWKGRYKNFFPANFPDDLKKFRTTPPPVYVDTNPVAAAQMAKTRGESILRRLLYHTFGLEAQANKEAKVNGVFTQIDTEAFKSLEVPLNAIFAFDQRQVDELLAVITEIKRQLENNAADELRRAQQAEEKRRREEAAKRLQSQHQGTDVLDKPAPPFDAVLDTSTGRQRPALKGALNAVIASPGDQADAPKKFTNDLWTRFKIAEATTDMTSFSLVDVVTLRNGLVRMDKDDQDIELGIIELIFQAILMYVYCPITEKNLDGLMTKLKAKIRVAHAAAKASFASSDKQATERIAYTLILLAYSALYPTAGPAAPTGPKVRKPMDRMNPISKSTSRASIDSIVSLIKAELAYFDVDAESGTPATNNQTRKIPLSDKDMLDMIMRPRSSSAPATKQQLVAVHDRAVEHLAHATTNPSTKDSSSAIRTTTVLADALMEAYKFILKHAVVRLEETLRREDEKLGNEYMSFTTVKHYAAATKDLLNYIVHAGPQSEFYPHVLSVMCSSAFLNIQKESMDMSTAVEDQKGMQPHGELYSRNVSMFNLTARFLVDYYVYDTNLIGFSIFGAKNEFVDEAWAGDVNKRVTVYQILVSMFRANNPKYDVEYSSWLQKKRDAHDMDGTTKAIPWEQALRDDASKPVEERAYDFFGFVNEKLKESSGVAVEKLDAAQVYAHDGINAKDKLGDIPLPIPENLYFVTDFFKWTVEYTDATKTAVPVHAYDWNAVVRLDASNTVEAIKSAAAKANVINMDETNNVISYISCANRCKIAIASNDANQSEEIRKCLNKRRCEASFTNVYDTMSEGKASESVASIANDMMVRQTLMYNQGLIIMSFGGSGVGKTSLLFGVKSGAHGGLIKSVYDNVPETFYFTGDKREFSVRAYELHPTPQGDVVYIYDKMGKANQSQSLNRDNQPAIVGIQNVEQLISELKRLDENITATRKQNMRIRPTVNNPQSSRSVMIYHVDVKYGEKRNVPLVIVDLPGYELIDADNSKEINNIIAEAMRFMGSGGADKSFLNKLRVPNNVKYRTTAFVIANQMGANPAKLDALNSSRIGDAPFKDVGIVPEPKQGESALLTIQRNVAIWKTLESLKAKRFGIKDDDIEAFAEIISGTDYRKFMTLKAELYWPRTAGHLSNGMLEFYNWIQRDQRVFVDLYATQFDEIAAKSLSK